MATKVTDNFGSITATGTYNPASITKAPEGGFTATFGITAGSCTVRLRAWNNATYKETLATVTLPVPSGSKAGDLFDTVPVNYTYDDIDIVVDAIATGTLTVNVVGVGV